jgi:type VI secretion system protein ImpL
VLSGAYSLAFVFLISYLISSFKKAQDIYNKMSQKVSLFSSKSDNLMEAYTQMQTISEMVERFRIFYHKGVPLSYGIGFIKTEKTYAKLKKTYFHHAYNLLGIPLAAYLESGIKNFCTTNYNMTYDKYLTLYRYLKAYLSISEEVTIDRSRIDTMVIRETIENDLYPAIQNLKKAEIMYPMNLEAILKKNIGLYCYFLKTGEMPLIQQNRLLVSQARNRLAQTPDAKIIYESIIGRLRKTAPSVTVPSLLSDGVILSKESINTLYTQEGWDRYVKNEIEIAIKNPVIIDWVTGKSDIGNVVMDEKKMKAELVSMYIDDICKQWLVFLESIYYKKPEGISDAAEFLRRLSAENSGISDFFENVLRLSKVNTLSKEKVAVKAVSDFAVKKYSSVKKSVPIAKDVILKKDTLGRIDQFFKPLMELVRSQDRSVGLSAYKEKLNLISEKMISCAEGKNFLEVFNGTEKDPLLSAWREAEKLKLSLPEYLRPAIISVIRKPVEIAAETIINSVSEELDEIWQRNVYSFYDSKLSGKYPFYKSNEDASVDAAMEFLRPNTGLIYGFILNNLSSYLVRDNGKWKSRSVGSIKLQFNEKFHELLKKADRISSSLFNSDGSRKDQAVCFIPLPGNKVTGALHIGEQEYKIVDGRFNLCLQWPGESQKHEITLRLFVYQSYTDELLFKGDWAFLRLFESAQINIQNRNSMIARWKRNIQNMIMLPYGVKVKFSETVFPFGEKEFFNINCPERIMERDAGMRRIVQNEID